MGRVHVIGAGLAGLSCAVRLSRAGFAVSVYEAAGHAGGRCRSFFDETMDCSIDNGNHLLLSANTAALDYLGEIGAADSLIVPPPVFPFVDLETGERWEVRPNDGPIPWWILMRSRRIPGTRPVCYLSALHLALAGRDSTIGDCLDTDNTLWHRFWEPLTVAVMNTPPEGASAQLMWTVFKASFMRGARHCRPMMARDGLSVSFVDPALACLKDLGAEVAFGTRLRAIDMADGRAAALDFTDRRVTLAADDKVVVALPPNGTATVLPEIEVPDESCTIFNAHIRLDEPVMPKNGIPFLGVLGGTAQWLMMRDNVVSITVSAADHLAEEPAETVAERVWQDARRALNLPLAKRPPMRVIKERRATIAQTPAAVRRRAGTRTRYANLLLAGDWTDTGFPATIEGAIRSGQAAAEAALAA